MNQSMYDDLMARFLVLCPDATFERFQQVEAAIREAASMPETDAASACNTNAGNPGPLPPSA